jgi:hypothetical protein
LPGYELAFAPVCWTKTSKVTRGIPGEKREFTSVGQPRIWIDFKRDEVVLDEPHSSMMNMHVWEFVAKQEVKKVEALSIGLFRDPMYNQRGAWPLGSPPSLRCFQVLKELTVYCRSDESTPETPELRD